MASTMNGLGLECDGDDAEEGTGMLSNSGDTASIMNGL